MTAQAKLAKMLRWQSEACRHVGSPLYVGLLEHAALDVEAGGPCLEVLAGHEDDDPRAMLPLRFMGGVHRLVLEGRAPELARAYAGDYGSDAWSPFQATVVEHSDVLRMAVTRGVQTNEVSRCAALLGGFLLVAEATGLPLRVLELGSSAGLVLRWDAYRYEGPGRAFGDPASPVRLDLLRRHHGMLAGSSSRPRSVSDPNCIESFFAALAAARSSSSSSCAPNR